MLVRSALVLALALPALVSGRFPVVGGVIGGVRPADGDVSELKTSKESVAAAAADSPARTPGKLRVVENSGVCGKVPFCLVEPHRRIHGFVQKLRQVSIKPPDMGT
jgi:hypothetical protein